MKDKLQRITARKAGKRGPAIVAVAHMLLLLIFRVLSTGEPYQERGATMDEHQRQRLIRYHTRRLGKLGIAPNPETPEGGSSFLA